MKNSIKFFSVLFMAVSLLVSCDEDNDPSDDNLFVGTYDGSVSYSNSENNTDISTDDGSVTVVKVGDNYRFDFSDGIPTLSGIEIEDNENTLVALDGAITIDEGNLVIAYTQGDETWGADCSR